MFSRALIAGIITLFLLAPSYSERFAGESTIEKVREHSVGITAIYWMDEETFMRKMKEKSIVPKIPFVPVTQFPRYYIAYIGAGTIIKPGNLVITVRHLFEHNNGTDGLIIGIWLNDTTQYEADIIKESDHKEPYDDYTLLKIRKKTKLPGIKIAKKEANVGDKVLFSGSTGGVLFRLRFGYLEDWKYFLRKHTGSGKLGLVSWHEFPFLCVHPGGPGDSGGGIFNNKGQLIGMMYCGIAMYDEEYIFSNPLDMLKAFLKDTPGERALEYEEYESDNQ